MFGRATLTLGIGLHSSGLLLLYCFRAIIKDNLHYLAPQLKKPEDFVGAKFYCPHALADGSWCICLGEDARDPQRYFLHHLRTI